MTLMTSGVIYNGSSEGHSTKPVPKLFRRVDYALSSLRSFPRGVLWRRRQWYSAMRYVGTTSTAMCSRTYCQTTYLSRHFRPCAFGPIRLFNAKDRVQLVNSSCGRYKWHWKRLLCEYLVWFSASHYSCSQKISGPASPPAPSVVQGVSYRRLDRSTLLYYRRFNRYSHGYKNTLLLSHKEPNRLHSSHLSFLWQS
jgi:hypothetical protein